MDNFKVYNSPLNSVSVAGNNCELSSHTEVTFAYYLRIYGDFRWKHRCNKRKIFYNAAERKGSNDTK